MSRQPRSKDYDIRAAVVASLLGAGVARCDIRHEITLDTSSSGGRLDILLLHRDVPRSIEIKSGSDKLTRLKGQVQRSRLAVDHCLVAADNRHDGKLPYSPSGTIWWDHDQRAFVYEYRGDWKPRAPQIFGVGFTASDDTSAVFMARLLWADEAKEVARTVAGATCRMGTRRASLDWIREKATVADLRPLVCAALRLRLLNRWESAFWARYDADKARSV